MSYEDLEQHRGTRLLVVCLFCITIWLMALAHRETRRAVAEHCHDCSAVPEEDS